MENDIRVKLMGVRGTMPVHGPDCRVFGGATSCVFVSMGGQAIILDAGTGLSGPGFDSFFGAEHFTLLLTHSHVDHIMGFPPFPALFDGRHSGEVYLKTRGGLDARAQLEKLMAPPLWPIKTSAVKADVAFRDVPESFSLGDVRVDTMEIGHPGGCTAYRLSFGGRSLVYATDYEPECDAPERFLNFARGCSLLLLDAQYTPAEYANTMGFGHSTTERSLRIARGCAAKTTLLVHHDPKRTDAKLLALEAELGTAQDIRFGREGEEVIF